MNQVDLTWSDGGWLGAAASESDPSSATPEPTAPTRTGSGEPTPSSPGSLPPSAATGAAPAGTDPAGTDSTAFIVVVEGGGERRLVTAPSPEVSVLGLKNGTPYAFQVFAVTANGRSEGSEVVTTTPTTGMEGVVAGVIVEFADTVQVEEGSRSVPGDDRVGAVDLSVAEKVTDDAVLVEFSEPVDLDTAEQIAADLAADELVEWAEPDQFFFTSTETSSGTEANSGTETSSGSDLAQTVSVPTDSEYAASQWNLWDAYGISVGDGATAMTHAWAGPRGDGVTVAVIDTGITPHPDLDGQLVPGYDFVSNPEQLASSRLANAPPVAFDGDYVDESTYGSLGRDANPTDPGDWRGVAPVRDSSWHGTKIAGLIAAQANDDFITGIAPNAKVQPVRALSWRGGLLSDIAASITWASGGVIDGVPANANPSKVINMSFAVETMCPTALQQAIDGAIERGSILVAAAGNAHDDASEFAPGNCNGVITVAATNRDGNKADYSNHGTTIDIAAPGGDITNPVTTTSNTGTQVPDQPTTAGDFGTSIAAAHVSAAAAILASRNANLTPSDAYTQLTGENFTKAFNNQTCDTANPDLTCGTGILSLAQIASSASGDVDYAMDFNGSSQYASATSSAFSLTGAFTFETWLYPRSCSDLQTYLRKNLSYAFSCLSTTWHYAINDGANSWFWRDTGVVASLNQWTHIAWSRASANSAVKLYVNGQLAFNDSASLGSLVENDSPLDIARDQVAGTWFNGRIDEVRIYSNERTEDQIATDMRTYGPVSTNGLVAYYDFNEGSGTTVFNRASSAVSATNLTTVSSPTFQTVAIETTPANAGTVIMFPRSYLTATGGWQMPASTSTARYLVVGGGGAGGTAKASASAGGGGGGQVRSGAIINQGSPISITVGMGGIPTSTDSATEQPGRDGGRSVLGTVQALGGGGGASFWTGGAVGSPSRSGFTGGGGAGQFDSSLGSQGQGGPKGGDGFASPTDINVQAGGGGGGSTAAGSNAGSSAGGAGGGGTTSSISGTSLGYGGGGGGGKRTNTGSAGAATAGGGAGGQAAAGAPGTPNRGGGGGGGGSDSGNALGGMGGSGVVIVSYFADCFTERTDYVSDGSAGTGVNGTTYRVLEFGTVGTCKWTPPTGVTSISALVVGGGGGGGGAIGGGGGGGRVVDEQALSVIVGSIYDIVVGSGGQPGRWGNTRAVGGGASSFGSQTAPGGGPGGTSDTAWPGGSGGSGGGGSCRETTDRSDPRAGGTTVAGTPTAGSGSTGGSGPSGSGPDCVAGGGGGASQVGENANADGPQSGGDGGDGIASVITGRSVFYGGGGGGGVNGSPPSDGAPPLSSGEPGTGGRGGGGAAAAKGRTGDSPSGVGNNGNPGTANTGGGGGGASNWEYGGAGGSGIVIVRYALTSPDTTSTIEIASGNNQSQVVDQDVSNAPTVLVRGPDGLPLSGASVTFAVASGAGSIGTTTVTTDAGGLASTSWRLGRVVGANTLTATLREGVSVTFTATGTPGPASKVVVMGPSSVVAGVTSSNFTVTSYDQFDNLAPVSTNTTFTLATNQESGTATFAPASGSLQIAAGASSATFTYSNTNVGSGPQTLTVARSAGDAVGSATASITVNPATASKLVVSSIGSQTAGVGFPVTVTLTDTYGNAVNNTGAPGTVTLTRGAGTGTLAGTTSGSIAVGASAVTISGVTYSKAESGVTVIATGTGASSLVADKSGTSSAFTVSAGEASAYVVTLSSTSPAAGSNETVTAQLQDSNGNDVAVAGKVITWGKSILGGTFASPTSTTDVNGQASVVFTTPTTSGRSGAITATDNTTPTALTGTSATLTTQVGPVDAAQSTLTASPSSVTADGTSTLTLTLQAKDQYGNNLTTSGDTVVITQSSGSATLGTVSYAGAGAYTATVTAPTTVGSSVFVATVNGNAVQGGGVSQQQVTTTYVAGSATKLVITGSGSQVAGQAQTITITAQDAHGNTATTYNGAKTLRFAGPGSSSNPVTAPTVGGVIFGSDTTVTFSSGQATASVVLFKAEATSISVSDPSASLSSSGAGNLAVTVSANDANKLVVATQPIAAASGALFSTQPVVRILDAYGNLTNSTASVTVSVAGVGGVLGGSEVTGKAASGGVATFTNLTFSGRVGTAYQLEFDSVALTGADSDDFTPTGAGEAQTIALNAGDGETATAGSAVPTPPSVLVTDSAGNPVSGVAVTFTVTGGGGSRAPTSAVNTNASGISALTSWTLGTTAGANTLQASASGLTGSPVTFNATGTPGSADSLRSAQNLAGAASGAAFTTQPWISIVDANDNVITTDNGTVVTASVSAGGTFVGTTTASTVNGVAKFTNLGLTGTSGTQYTVTFSATGVNSVDQSVTVTTGAASKLVVTTSASGATYGNVWTTQPVVQIHDSGGNLVATDSTTDVTVAITGQTITGTTTVQAVNGIATFSGLSLTTTPGTYTLTFSSTPALTGASSSLALAQAAQTISFGGLSDKTFGDAAFTFSATASSNLTVSFASQTAPVCSVSGTTVTILAVGTCTIRASQAGNTNYLAAPTVDQSFTVNQATPTFTWSNTVVSYGTNPYTITAPTPSTPGTFTYSSSNTSVIAITGSQVTVAGAGTAVVTATFTPADGANYTSGGTVTSSITVNTVELTVTASSPTVTYGDPVPTITASITGFVNGENASVLSAQPSCTTVYTRTSSAGSTPATSCSGAAAANYTFRYVTGAVTINKATPTVGAWGNVSKTYGDPSFALTAPAVTGVTGSALPGSITYGSGSTSVATVAGDNVTLVGAGSSVFTATFTPSDTTNYTSASTTMTLSVAAATVTVTASSPSVLYGAAVPAITATMTGFVYGQTGTVLTTQPTCTTAYTPTSPAGSTPSTSCSGAAAANYTFVYTPGAVTIGQATPTLGAWGNVSKTYGDPQFSLTNPSATGVTGAALPGSWAFSSGTTGVATVSGSTVSIAGAGSSTFTATFTPTDSTNYSTASTTMTLAVATTVLSVTASSASVTFGASVPSITPSYNGFVYGQGAGDLGTAPTCSTTYTDTSPVGSYPTICSGGVSNNYTFAYVGGTVTVGQATPSLSWSGVTKTYGDAPFTVTAPTATGVGGAAVTGVYTYISSDASVATVSGGVVTIVGAGSTTLTATFTPASSNYASGQTVTATLTVNRANQAALSITSPSSLIFGQTLTLAASGGSGTGAVTFSAVDGTATGCSATSTLGYSSTGTCDVTASKASDANYVAATPATQTVTIAKAGQTLAFTSAVPASPLPNGTYTPTVSSVSVVTGAATGITPSLTASGACTIAAGVVTFTVAGTCTVTAAAVGPYTNFLAATAVTQVIAVGSLNQNITFTQPGNVAFGSSSFGLSASASSDLPVSFALGAGTTNGACSVSALGVVTIVAVGTCEAVASQAGDGQYAPASPVTRAFQVVAALPTAPTLTSASASSQAITVGFTVPGFGGGVPITAYRLVATGGGTTVTSTACTASPCTISGLTNGTAYTVTVAAINSAGTGPASSATGSLTPATAAFAVGALAATPGNTTVTLTWTPLANAQLGGGTFTRYQISMRPAGTSSWSVVSNALTSQSADNLTIPGLNNGISYDFQVVAITSANASEIPGNTAQVVQYPSTVPSAPRNPTVLALTATDVQFSWAAPLSDGGSPLTNPNYTVTVSGPGVLANACDPGPTGTSCTVSGLANSAVYTFSVVANNRMGPSLAATDTYVVPSSDASLSNLVVNTAAGAAVLTPVFAAGTLEYTSSVTNAIASVTVTPTTNDPGATVTVDADPVVSGEASSPIALSVGANTITVEVTASDPRSSQTYTLTITRAAAPIAPAGGGAGGVNPGIPVVPPASVTSGAQIGAVTVNGVVESDVVLVRTPTNSGWEVMAPDFTLSVDTEAPTGALEPLLPSGVMQVPQGGLIAVNATGYAPESTLAMFAIPRSDVRQVGRIAARSMSNAVWLGSAIVAANGSARLTVAVPASLSTGDYVLQLNGETDQAQLRSVNLQLVVEPGVQMRAATITGAAFFEGRSATLSAAGEMRLNQMVASIPEGASEVTVSVVGVSVSRETPRENLQLARDRAEQISDYLIEQGVSGKYRVSVFTEFTIEPQQRSVTISADTSPMESPMTSSTGKPLTTASISFEAPTQPLQ